MWRINREMLLLGVGPATLLLQIAHPLVAEAVAAHSRFEQEPFERLGRTLSTTLGIVFGDGPTATAAIRRLNGVHQSISGDVGVEAGVITAATSYRALDPELLLWVQSTLVIMGVRAYRAWIGPVSDGEAEQLWAEARHEAPRMGLPTSVTPASYRELERWFEAQLGRSGSVVVTATARRLSQTIVRPPLPYLPGPLVDLLATPGLALLPPRIRADYGIPWSAGRAALAAGLRRWIRVTSTLVPPGWRVLPVARAAELRARRARSAATSATIPPASHQESSTRAKR